MEKIGKILTTILIFATVLFGAVETKVNKEKIVRGDSLTVTIDAIGDKVVFPKIETIAGYEVVSAGDSQYISMINGQKLVRMSKKFLITPLQSFIIPSFEIDIDGEIEKTKPIPIEVTKPKKSKNPYFDLEIHTDKKEAYVGEPINLTIVFKRKIDKKISNANFNPPAMKGFWTKKLADKEKTVKNGFFVHRIEYILYPERAGIGLIDNSSISVGQIKRGTDMFSMFVERIIYEKIYSNEIKIDVKALPKGVKLYGDYKLKIKIDKKKVKANEPVNVTIEIKGVGNVDDIDEFKIDIENTTVYKDNPKREMKFKDGKFKSTFIQKFAIIGDSDFTIPAFKIRFFDGKKIRVKATKSIDIEVIANLKENRSYIVKPIQDVNQTAPQVVIKDSSFGERLLFLFFGFILSFVFIAGWYFIKYKLDLDAKEESNYSKLVKKSKSDKELLIILLPFVGKHRELDLIISKLEENVYKKSTHQINKRILSEKIEIFLKM